MRPSLTMIIPAYNEEGDLEATLTTVFKAIDGKINDYEILIFNDNSQDQTGAIADRWAAKNQNIRVIHNTQNMGLGYNYRTGVHLATKDYIGWVPGKNSIPQETLDNMFQVLGQADIVAVYILTETRSHFRHTVSNIFTMLMNLLFGMNLKYFNGPNILRSDILKRVKMSTDSFAFMAEVMVRLIKSGHTYVEVGLHNKDRTSGNSKAFAFKNFRQVVEIVFRLFWEVQIVGMFRRIYKRAEPGIEVKRQLS
jgi:glycosyltransferase involved in cell wall biosynthesis